MFLAPLGPRGQDFAVLKDTRIDAAGARRLAEAADACWGALLRRDLPEGLVVAMLIALDGATDRWLAEHPKAAMDECVLRAAFATLRGVAGGEA